MYIWRHFSFTAWHFNLIIFLSIRVEHTFRIIKQCDHTSYLESIIFLPCHQSDWGCWLLPSVHMSHYYRPLEDREGYIAATHTKVCRSVEVFLALLVLYSLRESRLLFYWVYRNVVFTVCKWYRCLLFVINNRSQGVSWLSIKDSSVSLIYLPRKSP